MASHKTKQILEKSQQKMQKKLVVLSSSLKKKTTKTKREAKRFHIKSQLATLRPYLLSSYPLQRRQLLTALL